jgi:hypothetical protein
MKKTGVGGVEIYIYIYIYIYYSGSKVGVIRMVLSNRKGPTGSEDKWKNPRSHSYSLQTGYKDAGMEHNT